MKPFDRKLGPGFLAALPAAPGVYRVLGAGGQVIYVGKAKNLRRRLAQYRNAKRRKKHARMRAIVAEAARIEITECPSHLEACLLENRLIRDLRPKWNVAGAFHFMYPMVGVVSPPRGPNGSTASETWLICTTRPEAFPEARMHGAFRSRQITLEAFEALSELLAFVFHPVARSRLYSGGGPAAGALARRDRFARVAAFRGVPADWLASFERFLDGSSRDSLETLVLALAESQAARRRMRLIQDRLNSVKRFWNHEALALARARRRAGHAAYPVAQRERDDVFLRARLRSEG